MVCLRFSSFIFGLFVSISLHTFAYSHKDGEKQVQIVATNTLFTARMTPLSLPKDILNAVPTRAEVGTEQVSGRKMMKRKNKMLKEEGINIGETRISGATSYGLKVKKRSNKQNIGYNLSDKRGSLVHHRRRMKARMAGFEGLNADYKSPMSHPPRNN